MSFDARAAAWDDEGRRVRAQAIANEMKRCLPKGGNALEFGCGTGLISFALADHFRAITLIDSSKGMIDVVTQKLATAQSMTHMQAHQIDISRRETVGEILKPSSFDVAFMSMALHHVKDVRGVLVGLYGFLAERGILCIVDLDEGDGSFHGDDEAFDGHDGFNQNWLREALLEVGYVSADGKTFYNGVRQTSRGTTDYSLFIMTANK